MMGGNMGFHYEIIDGKNFLVATLGAGNGLGDPCLKMLEMEGISNILPGFKKRQNGDVIQLLYHVQSKVSLAQATERVKINKKGLLELVEGLISAFKWLRGCPDKSLDVVLEMDRIYVELGKEGYKPKFVYLPVCGSGVDLEELRRFLLELVSSDKIEIKDKSFMKTMRSTLDPPTLYLYLEKLEKVAKKELKKEKFVKKIRGFCRRTPFRVVCSGIVVFLIFSMLYYLVMGKFTVDSPFFVLETLCSLVMMLITWFKYKNKSDRSPSSPAVPSAESDDTFGVKRCASLEYDDKDGKKQILLDKPRVIVGRLSSHVDYAVADERKIISKMHAAFSNEGDSYFVTDYNSENGTYIGDERIPGGTPREIVEGVSIKLAGEMELKFKR